MIRLNAPRLLKRLRPYRAADGEIRGEVSASVRAGGGAPAPLEIECPRESDVLDALASSRWPHRVDAELSNHVASCAICRDVITVASAIQADHDDAWHEASVPPSGQMWWRAEMRARQAAIRDASRPVTVAQGVAAVFALALAGVAAWFAWPSLHSLFSAIVPGGDTPTAFASPLFIPIAIAMGAFLVLAPVAIYVVMSEK